MTTEDLQTELDALAAKIPGKVAYCFEHPASGARVERNAAECFIAASVIKTPILMEAFRQAAHDGLDWKATLPLQESDKVGGSGVLNVLHDGLQTTVRDVATLMTVVSDNTATNMMLDFLGVEKVNAFLKDQGCTVTRCIRKLYDTEAIAKGIHNTIAAGEITGLLKTVAQGALVSAESDADLIGIMKKQQYREKIPHMLPKDAVTATKSGSLDEVSHDCGIVYLPNGDWFALSIFTGDLVQSEEGPARDAVNNTIAEMSLACYLYAEG
jgi:beta-lactamase class A